MMIRAHLEQKTNHSKCTIHRTALSHNNFCNSNFNKKHLKHHPKNNHSPHLRKAPSVHKKHNHHALSIKSFTSQDLSYIGSTGVTLSLSRIEQTAFSRRKVESQPFPTQTMIKHYPTHIKNPCHSSQKKQQPTNKKNPIFQIKIET